MAEIHLRLNPVFIAAFRDLVEGFSRRVGEQLAVQADGPDPDDEIMQEAWREGLLDTVRQDCAALIDLLKDSGLGRQTVELSEDKAIAIMRACSAVRLKIQQLFLKPYADEQLEHGDLDFDEMEPEDQQVYACYIFLAGLQEMLIQELDPDAASE